MTCSRLGHFARSFHPSGQITLAVEDFRLRATTGSLPSAVRTPLSKLAAVTAVATYLLIVLGAVVRATDSGLGCPDWPTCHGRWIPPFEKEALIEYSHRSLAALVGLLVVAVVITAWRRRTDDRRSWWLSVGALGLLAIQAWLGRQVVLTELSPGLVSIHFGTAMGLLALLLLIALPEAQSEADRGRAWRIWLGTGAVFAVILVGALVRGSAAGLAFLDWPLMDGAAIPTDLDGSSVRLVHFLHRLIALAVGVYVIYLWATLRRSRDLLSTLSGFLLAFYALQAAIGAAAVWTRLSAWTIVGHVAVAALTWAIAFVLPFSRSLDRQPALIADS